LNNVGFEGIVRTGVWTECGGTTILLSNITSSKAKDKFPYPINFGSKTKKQQA
jgi:hypothetical protein